MKRRPAAHQLIDIGPALLASSCDWVPSYDDEPGVTTERVAMSTGIVSSPHFWADTHGFQFRNEITPQPIAIGPLGGHVDIAVISPAGAPMSIRSAGW